MFLPGAIYLFINNYIPMGGIIVAFKNYNARKGILGSPWSGLKNFQFLFATPDALVITRNTLLYNLIFIILNTVLGIIFAIFICDCLSQRLKKMYQSAILFPYLMSAVIEDHPVIYYGINNSICKYRAVNISSDSLTTDFDIVKHSNLEYPLDYFSLTKWKHKFCRFLPDHLLDVQ